MDKNSVVVVCDSYYLSVKSAENTNSRSPSPRSPSPNRPLRGFNLFRVISKKIGRSIRQSKEYKFNSSDDDEDSNSSVNSISRSLEKTQISKTENSNECDCFYGSHQRRVVFTEESYPRVIEKEKPQKQEYGKKCLKFSTSCRHHHSSGSDTCSSNDDSSESNETMQKTKRSHSSSNESSTSSSSADSYKTDSMVRKGLKNLNHRSLSCFSLSQMKEVKERIENSSKEKRTKKSPQKILRPPATHTYVRGISGLPTLKVINSRGCYNNQYSRG